MNPTYDLLRQLILMVEATDFNRCSASRAFKGQYDVWLHNNYSALEALEDQFQDASVTADTSVETPVEDSENDAQPA